MAAMRCSPCDIYYPSDKTTCEACGGELWKIRDESHDKDWKKQVEDIKGEQLPDHLEWDYELYPVLSEWEYKELDKRRGIRQ